MKDSEESAQERRHALLFETQTYADRLAMVSVVVEPSSHGWDAMKIYTPERVQQMVRRVLLEWGLGQKRSDAPLADLIVPGSKVLLKPNWVVDRNAGPGGVDCLYTNQEVILAVLKEVLIAKPGRVTIGDAPIQSCNLSALVSDDFRSRVQYLAHKTGIEIEVIDFRRTLMSRGLIHSSVKAGMRDMHHFVLFDLGPDSLLEPLCTRAASFRVGDYDPRELARTHCAGHHQYLLCREAFDADVVISLPKLKMHCKAGLTGALKNLVGLNGNKDFLPHYRFGGSAKNGDCYEGWSLGRELSEQFEDLANHRLNLLDYSIWKNAARAFRLVSGGAARMGGEWYGNDTVWRMVLDLNRILIYGNLDGSMSDTPRRVFYSLTDALICGEGNGPLRPTPRPLGAMTFGSSPVACDLVHAALLRVDAALVPLLREAVRQFRWPLVGAAFSPMVLVNGERLALQQVAGQYGVNALPPSGWRSHMEWTAVRTGGVSKAVQAR